MCQGPRGSRPGRGCHVVGTGAVVCPCLLWFSRADLYITHIPRDPSVTSPILPRDLLASLDERAPDSGELTLDFADDHISRQLHLSIDILSILPLFPSSSARTHSIINNGDDATPFPAVGLEYGSSSARFSAVTDFSNIQPKLH